MNVFFETPRLILRDWSENDLGPFARMNADPRVMEFFPHPLDDRQTRDFYQRIRTEIDRQGYGLWALEDKQDGRFIGFTGFHAVGFEAFFTPAIEIGWRLCHDVWGQGLASEAAAACLSYGEQVLGLHEICSFTTVVNRRSQRVMQKIGMERIAEFDHPRLPIEHPLSRHVLYRVVLTHGISTLA